MKDVFIIGFFYVCVWHFCKICNVYCKKKCPMVSQSHYTFDFCHFTVINTKWDKYDDQRFYNAQNW